MSPIDVHIQNNLNLANNSGSPVRPTSVHGALCLSGAVQFELLHIIYRSSSNNTLLSCRHARSGVDHRLVLDGCRIATNHAVQERDSYLCTDRTGQGRILPRNNNLPGGKYFYHGVAVGCNLQALSHPFCDTLPGAQMRQVFGRSSLMGVRGAPLLDVRGAPPAGARDDRVHPFWDG